MIASVRWFYSLIGKEATVKKLLDEFKEFINRGNVMDLVVSALIVRVRSTAQQSPNSSSM